MRVRGWVEPAESEQFVWGVLWRGWVTFCNQQFLL